MRAYCLKIKDLWTSIRSFRVSVRDNRGQIAIMTALIAPMLIGGLGLGAETSYWYVLQRGEQNAADAAVVAAATNTSPSYISEGRAVSAQMGFTHASNNVTVTVTNNATCPDGRPCYQVTVSQVVPLELAQLVGYPGDTTLNGAAAVTISATSYSLQGRQPRKYCLLALGTPGQDLTGNGVPQTNFAGCNLMSDSDARCTGHNAGADFVDAVGTDDGCGTIGNSGQPSVADPYHWMAANVPANPCGSYPQESGGTVATWTGNKDISSSSITTGATTVASATTNGSPPMPITYVCGDLKLTGNTTLTSAAGGSLLVIENGLLDTQGFTLATATGSQMTIIFSGTAGSYSHYPTGTNGSTLNIQAPPTGTWHGVSIFQDPALTQGVDIASAGNQPTWDITGLVYLPNSNVTFKGAVNKSSFGASCFVMVAKTIYISGTGAIFETGGCDAAGLTMPTSPVAIRGQLVG